MEEETRTETYGETAEETAEKETEAAEAKAEDKGAEEQPVSRNQVDARGTVYGFGRDNYGHQRVLIFAGVMRGGYRRRTEKAQDERRNQDGRPVIVSFSTPDDVSQSFRIGDHVHVTGHVVGYSYHNEVWNRQGYMQYIVLDSIEPEKSNMEVWFGKRGFTYPESSASVLLCGTIAHVTKSQNGNGASYTRLSIRLSNGSSKRENSVNVQYNDHMRVAKLIPEEGDTVAVWCGISFKKKGEGLDAHYFEDLVVSDMVILRKADGSVPEEIHEERKERKRASSARRFREPEPRIPKIIEETDPDLSGEIDGGADEETDGVDSGFGSF